MEHIVMYFKRTQRSPIKKGYLKKQIVIFISAATAMASAYAAAAEVPLSNPVAIQSATDTFSMLSITEQPPFLQLIGSQKRPTPYGVTTAEYVANEKGLTL
ncbi:hypothetical protein [Shewanella sp. GutDb-MelDb]|uniref:hypothetical protein n=1 Tax=Shewanella sp. GutDb-MelDb TaxID=2058316 RepID=UPI0011AE37B6|nr:hypothetical protein [Shewanella sp. GutDb-MelDb]